MSHIFISYARKDIDFAQKIVDALAANNLDTWIDWKSIPKGEDWEQEIYRGIEEADAFLFLISPDSVASQMCNKEIAHAVKNGKRILPIVIRDADFKHIQPEISKRNWIFCRDGQDDFDQAITKTHETIHTNYDWLKYHTRLQVKALEWERTKDNSRLLRGKELRDAEEQLADISGNEDPQPNRVQREYVLSSRRYEDIQRRRFTIALGTLVLIAFLAALVALLQAKEAKQASANQLLAEARTAIGEQNYHLAGLLALEAESRSEGVGQDLLATLPYLGPAIGYQFKGHNGGVTGIGWTLDDRLVSSSVDGTINIWDMSTHKPAIILGDGASPFQSIAISPKGLLASGNNDGDIEIWNLATGRRVVKSHISNGSILSLAWSQNNRLGAGSADGSVTILDSDGHTMVEFHEHIDKVTSVAWSSSGELASASLEGNVIIWDEKHDTSVSWLEDIQNPVTSLIWMSNNVIATGLENGQIILWDVATSQKNAVLDDHRGSVNSLAVTNEGQIISGSSDGRVLLWNMDTLRPQAVYHEYSKAQVNVIAWSENKHLASGSEDGQVILWDLETGHEAPTLKGHPQSVDAIAWSDDGRFASGSADGSIEIWNTKNWLPIKTLYGKYKSDSKGSWDPILLNGVISVAWSPKNKLASGLGDGRVVIWGTKPDEKSTLLASHKSAVVRVAWSKDARLASATIDGEVIVWDLANRVPVSRFQYPGKNGYQPTLNDIVWSPDGQRIVMTSTDYVEHKLIIWDVRTNKSQIINLDLWTGDDITSLDWSNNGGIALGISFMVPIGNEKISSDVWIMNDTVNRTITNLSGAHTNDSVSAIAWSQNGQRLASGSENGDVVIWDIVSGEFVRFPHKGFMNEAAGDSVGEGHSSAILSLAWSTNGRLASSSKDGTLIIWDETTKKPAIKLKGHNNPINSIAWSNDGKLSSGSVDGNTIVWDLNNKLPDKTFYSKPLPIQAIGSGVLDMAWSKDNRLAASLKDGLIIVWDGRLYELVTPMIEGHTDALDSNVVYSLAFSPDDELTTVAGEYSADIIIWDGKTGKPKIRIDGREFNSEGRLIRNTAASQIFWSSKGQLASAANDGTVAIWDSQNSKLIFSFKPKEYANDSTKNGNGFQIAWSPNGLIASADLAGRIEISDPISGELLKQLPNYRAGITSLSWSTTNRLATSDTNGQIIIWNEIFTHPDTILKGHTGRINKIAWSNNGYLASAGEDTFVRILPPPLTVTTCEWLARNFSQEEWVQYFSIRLLSSLGIDLVYVPGYEKTCSNLPMPNGKKLGFSLSGDSLGLLGIIVTLVTIMSGITIFIIYKRNSKAILPATEN